jgi:protein-disulfide isomerase
MIARCLVASALATACVSSDPHGDETAHRIVALEQQVAQQQHQIEELRHAVGGAPEIAALLEQMGALASRIAQLEDRGAGAPARPRRREPDPARIYGVPVGHSPVAGAANAKVTLVMAGEFACPFCRKAWDTVEELRKKYGADLRVVYKSFVVHPQRATVAAKAACAAQRQGKWHAMAELLWAKAFDAAGENDHAFEASNIDGLAAEARLDMKKYRADFDGACLTDVKAEQDEMTRFGVMATPTFFINGRYLAGAQPIEAFSTLIDEELAKANAAIQRGVRQDRYYDQEIVGKGLKDLEPAPNDLAPNPYK